MLLLILVYLHYACSIDLCKIVINIVYLKYKIDFVISEVYNQWQTRGSFVC